MTNAVHCQPEDQERRCAAEDLIVALSYLSIEAQRNGFPGTSRLIETAARSLSTDTPPDAAN